MSSRSNVCSFLSGYTSRAYLMLKKCAVFFFYAFQGGEKLSGNQIITEMSPYISLSGVSLLCLASWFDI